MTAKQVIDIAKSQVGVSENPPGSNRCEYNRWYYGHDVTGPDYPWCAVFISWLFRSEQTLCPKTASCVNMLSYFQQRGQLVKNPQAGDIVFFKYSTNNRKTNHVGLVVSVSDNGKIINTIEGNTSQTSADNGGKVMQRNRYSNIVAYARPAYSGTTTTMMPPASMPVLKKGSKGDWVVIAQGRLVVAGYKIEVDGVFGPKTEEAVKKYQADHHLTVTGIIGKNTWSALYK